MRQAGTAKLPYRARPPGRPASDTGSLGRLPDVSYPAESLGLRGLVLPPGVFESYTLPNTFQTAQPARQ